MDVCSYIISDARSSGLRSAVLINMSSNSILLESRIFGDLSVF